MSQELFVELLTPLLDEYIVDPPIRLLTGITRLHNLDYNSLEDLQPQFRQAFHLWTQSPHFYTLLVNTFQLHLAGLTMVGPLTFKGKDAYQHMLKAISKLHDYIDLLAKNKTELTHVLAATIALKQKLPHELVDQLIVPMMIPTVFREFQVWMTI
jgi:hypothetical protein